MDIQEIKEQIKNDFEINIRKILEEIGCDRISTSSKEIRCAKNKQSTNSTKVVVKNDDNLSSRIYDDITVKGDIFTLVMAIKGFDKLGDAIKLVKTILGIKGNSYQPQVQKKKAFGGFFSTVKKDNTRKIELKTYDDSILDIYANINNRRFLEDGIGCDIQAEFDIMFDFQYDKIIVPWRDINGRIVGIMGRENKDESYCKENNIAKWKPLDGLSFPKSCVLYGLYQNYKHILQAGRVYVGESEKFVLQCASMGIRNTVAIGSHEIGEEQKNILLSLGVDIVLAYDSDVPLQVLGKQGKYLQSTTSLRGGKVGCMITSKVIDVDKKGSPSDFGKEIWNQCIENIIWV